MIGVDELHKEPSAVVEVYEPAANGIAGRKGTTVMASFYPGYVREGRKGRRVREVRLEE